VQYGARNAGSAHQRVGRRYRAAAGLKCAGVSEKGHGGRTGHERLPRHGAGLQRGTGAGAQHRDAAHRGDALTAALEAATRQGRL